MATVHRAEIQPDPTKTVDINVVALGPHVVVYRMWFKPADGKYGAPIATGDTADNVPDTLQVREMAKGSAAAYFLAIGGRKTVSPYRALVTFAQDGATLPGGTCLHDGVTDTNGYAEVWAEVSST